MVICSAFDRKCSLILGILVHAPVRKLRHVQKLQKSVVFHNKMTYLTFFSLVTVALDVCVSVLCAPSNGHVDHMNYFCTILNLQQRHSFPDSLYECNFYSENCCSVHHYCMLNRLDLAARSPPGFGTACLDQHSFQSWQTFL